jgi:hypothetical protein
VRSHRPAARCGRALEALIDAIVAPPPSLPPVAETDALDAFHAYLTSSPPAVRVGFRAALVLLEPAPFVLGFQRPWCQLGRARRVQLLDRLASTKLAPLIAALRMVCAICYHGDERVLAALGYDPSERVERGDELRAAEQRW